MRFGGGCGVRRDCWEKNKGVFGWVERLKRRRRGGMRMGERGGKGMGRFWVWRNAGETGQNETP